MSRTLVLNDQGGGVMNVSLDITATLRAQDHGHPPLVYESHGQDCRYKPLKETCETLSAKYGLGGNNVPIVLESNQNHAIAAETETSPTLPASMGMGGGYVPMIVMQRRFSNVMVSETDTAPTLEAGAGEGGNNLPMIVDTLVFDEGQITSPTNGNVPKWGDASHSLSGNAGRTVAIIKANCMDVGFFQTSEEQAGSLLARQYKDPPITFMSEEDGQDEPSSWDGSQIAPTLTVNNAGGGQRMPDKDNFNAVIQSTHCFQNTGQGWWNESDTGATVRTPCGGDSTKANLVTAVDCRNGVEDADVNASLQAASAHNTNSNNVCRSGNVVRRLTPDECASLQGFPRNWCNIGEWVDSKGKLHKDADSPKYKAYGNSIAVGYDNQQSGFWCWLARRICAQYERQITMASLFDGIGGFPLAFSACGAVPVWASEIEEFPIAVTKYHFPEEDGDD